MIPTALRFFHLPAVLACTILLTSSLIAQETARLDHAALPEAPIPQVDRPAEDESITSLSSSSQQPQATPQQEKPKPDENEADKELHQRMAGVVPNFNAVLGGQPVPPLTPKQKMRAAFRSAVDPYQFGLAVLSSGIGQAENSHEGYGQGWEGYGKRYGAAFTDQFDGTILGNGVFPILLHQDSRYYRMGTGSFKKRLFYSMSTTIRCKSDKGNWQPNYSNILGNLAAGGISNLYYPKEDRGFGLTMEQGLVVTAEGVFGAFLVEFYPDIHKYLHRKHPKDATVENPQP